MANYVTSPNMSLTIPIAGQDPGPDYANNNNGCFLILDGHDHTSGKGVSITPAGLDINVDLSFSGNNATALRSVRFNPQSSVIGGASDINCLSVSGVDLYYNDGNGNKVRITQSGSVTGSSGTITGLPSGTASAAYVSINGTFVFQSATNTPANLDGASLILRDQTANSFGVTLNAPSSLGANYGLVMPQIPGQQSFVSLDTSGNLGTTVTSAMANVVGTTMTVAGADAIGATMDSTGADAIAASRTRGVNNSTVGGVGISSAFTGVTTSQYPTYALFGTVSVTTSGRPVAIGLTAGYPTGYVLAPSPAGETWYILFSRNGGNISEFKMTNVSASSANALSPGAYNYIDYACPAGANTYSIYMATGNSSFLVGMNNVIAYAYEL